MLLGHAHMVHIRHMYACIGLTAYDTFCMHIYQRNSAVELTSMGLAHACPNNIIHRPEEALDIQSKLIFINGMVHLPQE